MSYRGHPNWKANVIFFVAGMLRLPITLLAASTGPNEDGDG